MCVCVCVCVCVFVCVCVCVSLSLSLSLFRVSFVLSCQNDDSNLFVVSLVFKGALIIIS